MTYDLQQLEADPCTGSSDSLSGTTWTHDSTSDEDGIPFEICGRSLSSLAKFGLSDYDDWLLRNNSEEYRKGYDLHKRLFQHLQYQRPGKRYVFRMQWHILMLDTILKVYPDAEIVVLHG